MSKKTSILALDIGAGTKDILLYEEGKKLENCIKMVLPSPSLIYAEQVEEATTAGRDLFVSGATIGGGKLSASLKTHLRAGCRVFMTERAALTVRNSLDEVAAMGIRIVPAEPEGFPGQRIELDEIELPPLVHFLRHANLDLFTLSIVAIAVQDHGASPQGVSNRRVRLETMRQLLEKTPSPLSLVFSPEEIPRGHFRMQSAAAECRQSLPDAQVFITDTAPAAIYGCLEDPLVHEAATVGDVLTVNVGNSHTMAALITGERIKGIFEHHTGYLGQRKLLTYLKRFADGELTGEEVFQDGGHGAFYLEGAPGSSRLAMVAATGPNRSQLSEADFRVYYAAPAGDVMMAGPLGLVRAALRKMQKVELMGFEPTTL